MGNQEGLKYRVTQSDLWFQQVTRWLFGEELIVGRPKRERGLLGGTWLCKLEEIVV